MHSDIFIQVWGEEERYHSLQSDSLQKVASILKVLLIHPIKIMFILVIKKLYSFVLFIGVYWVVLSNRNTNDSFKNIGWIA